MSVHECTPQYWDDMWTKEKRKGFTDGFFEAFKPYIKGVVLDIGGGYTHTFEKYATCPITQYYNLDFSSIALQKSKSDYPTIQTICANLEDDCTFATHYFDTILAVQIFEHLTVKTLTRLQTRLFHALKDAGNLLVEIPLKLPHAEHKIVFDDAEDFMILFKDWNLAESKYVKENVENLILRLTK